MSSTLPRLAGAGTVLLVLNGAALLLLWAKPVPMGHEARVDAFVALLAAAVIVYLAATALVLRGPAPRGGLAAVLAIAALMRLMLLPAPPLLSSDIYRYVWDGRVQEVGINPYRYVPADDALKPLRDAVIYPSINRKDYARTIYPPAAQIVFAAVARVDASVFATKLTMLAFEALGIFCMLRLLAILGLPRERVLIYAWNPLALWAFACDGHVDALAVGTLGVALLLRAKRRPALAGAALAVAALTKFIPLAVAPAFVRGAGLWRPAAAGAVTVALLYALYASAGWHVLGFLSGYGREEGLESGSGIWLLAGLGRLATLPRWAPGAYVVAVAAVYGTASVLMMRGRTAAGAQDAVLLCRDTAILAGFATAAISPHYAWYMPWMGLPCIIAPVPAVVWLSSASVLLYVDPLHERFIWPSLVYIPALALLVRSALRARRAWHPAAAGSANQVAGPPAGDG